MPGCACRKPATLGGGTFSYGQVSSPKTRSHLRPMRVDEGESHLRQAAAETCPVDPSPGNGYAGSFLAHRSSPSIPFRTSGDRLDLSQLERVTKIGVSFEELDLLHFASMRTSVPQDVEAVADVYHID